MNGIIKMVSLSSTASDEMMNPEVILKDRFRIEGAIGRGGFGLVRGAYDQLKNRHVAIKTELKMNSTRMGSYSTLHLETLVMRKMHKDGLVLGFPRYVYFGRTHIYSDGSGRGLPILVMELLGPSLHELLQNHDYKFSLKTILLIVDQLLDRFERLHGKGILHRDIKPSNILIGRKENGMDGVIYLIDYGIARAKANSEALLQVKEDDKEPFGFVGTVPYMSVRAHQKLKLGKKDDLESLVYLIAGFINGGTLPWVHLEDLKDKEKSNKVIMEMKANVKMTKLFENMPLEFSLFGEMVRKLKVDEEPKYQEYRDMFRRLGTILGVDYNQPKFDWSESEKKKEINQSLI